MFPHLCPDASPPSAIELGISKTVLGSNPWEQLREKNHHIQKVGDGWGTMRKASGFCSIDIPGKKMKEQICTFRAEGSYLPASLTHSPQYCLCFSLGHSFLRGNNEHSVAKEKSRGFQKKAALMWKLSQLLRKLKIFSILAWMMISRL